MLLDIEVVGSKIVHDKRPDTPLIFVIPLLLRCCPSGSMAATPTRRKSFSAGWSGQKEELKGSFQI